MTTPTPYPDPADPTDPASRTGRTGRARRRGRGLMIGVLALVVLLAVAGGIAVVVHEHGDSSSGRPASATPAATAPASTTAATPTSSAALALGLTRAPAGVSWHSYRGLELPVSATAGPAIVDGPVQRNFAHTPEGALIAAIQIPDRYFVTPNGGWRQVLDQQVMPGPGRSAYAKLRATLSDTVPAAGFAQVAGFRFVTYSPDLCVISIANRAPSGTLSVADTTLQWADGDWKIQLAPSGLPQSQAVSDLSGYVVWAAP